MKTLDTILNLISFLILALVLWAIMPLLLKLIALLTATRHLFGS